MLKKWIDSLFLGTWHLPSGDIFHCGPSERDYYFSRAKEYLNAGVPLPVCLEHQPDVGLDGNPIQLSFHEKLAKQTAATVGHCHDVRIGDEGQIQFEVDGDEESFKIMRRNKYVSPEIRQNVIDHRTGKRFAGPSIVHLAVTPRPVQNTGSPHIHLSAANSVSLSAITVDVSLSSASYEPAKKDKDNKMAAKPKDPAEETKPPEGDAKPPEGLEPPKDSEPGEDLEGGDPLLMAEETTGKDATKGAEMGAEEGAAIAELTSELSELGIEFHGSASDSLLAFCQHLNTAIKTHKSTKAGGPAPEAPAEGPDKPYQDDQPTNQEAEQTTTESAPIMMSAATPTDREQKLTAKILKDTQKDLTNRLNVLHARHWIDDKIKGEQMAKLGTIKLSASDINDDGDVRPNEVSVFIGAIERLMASGKPAPFTPKAAAPKPPVNPQKPISSSMSLSASQDEHVVMADRGDPPATGEGEIIPSVLDQMTGGRYSEYAKSLQKA